MNATLLGILGYIVVQIAIGMALTRRTRTEEDYLLAGRGLGPWIATMSVFATWFGAETCMGSAGSAYESGRFSWAQPEPFAYGACLLVMGALLARKLWNLRLTTMADFFRQRFGPGVERFAALLMIPTSVLWAAAQVRAFGQVLASSTDISREVAIGIATLAVLVYSVAGGMWADAMTDMLQGAVICIGLAALAAVVVFAPQATQVSERVVSLATTPDSGSWLEGIEAWAIPIMGSVFAQELVARVCASRSAGIARRAATLGGLLYLAIGALALWLGSSGARLHPGLEDPEWVLPVLAQDHLHGVFYVLFAGALVSAILSTVDSTLLVAASLFSHNLVLRIYPTSNERTKVRVARAGVILFGLIASGLALSSEGVSQLVEWASSLGSSGIFVAAALGLFTAIGNQASAYLALSVGASTYLVGQYLSWPVPYLSSVGLALAAYCGGVLWPGCRTRAL